MNKDRFSPCWRCRDKRICNRFNKLMESGNCGKVDKWNRDWEDKYKLIWLEQPVLIDGKLWGVKK